MTHHPAMLALSFVLIATAASSKVAYPANQTVSDPMSIAPEDRLQTFMSIGTILTATFHQPAFIAAVHILRDADDKNVTICGSALIGEHQRPAVFVVTSTKAYIDVSDAGLRSLGCMTRGGLSLSWHPHTDGTEGMEIR